MINKKFFLREKDELLQFLITILLQLAILLVILGSFFRQQWLIAFTGSAILTLTFIPAIIERRFNIRLPIEFTLVTCLFLYASFGLGEASHFYQKFWWWDLMLHSFSSLLMGLAGFLFIYVFLYDTSHSLGTCLCCDSIVWLRSDYRYLMGSL